MTRFIVPLSDRAATDPDRVGTEGGESRCGWRMPACRRRAASASPRMPIGGRSSISDCRCTARIPERRSADAAPALGRDQAEALSERSRAGSAGAILGAWWEEQKPAAVRSSALIEDRADTSFAGQFESFLASPTTPNFSPRCAPAGRRCGPPMHGDRWRSTNSIRPAPRWRCWCSRSSPRASRAAV